MKQLFTILFLAVISMSAYGQAPNIIWEKSLGGGSNDNGYSIHTTNDGGYIVVGACESNDGQVTGHHGDSSTYDYWVTKLDDTGGIQWETSLGGTSDDLGWCIQQTTDSGYIIAGASESSDSDLSTCTVVEYNYWVVKLSSSGSIVWKSCYGSLGGGGFNQAYYIQELPDSNYIVAGYTNSADSGEVTGYMGGSDYWIINISSTGAIQWGKCYGGTALDIARCIQKTTDGGYIVAGYSRSNDDQVTGHHGSTSTSDYWILKLDDTGAIQWEKSLGGTSNEFAYSIRQTFDSGYIVGGSSYSINGDVTGHHGDSTTSDYWVVKLDDTGGIQWENSFGGSQNETAYSIAQTIDSGYIIAGSSNSTDGDVTGNHGLDDYWIVKLSKTGSLQFQQSYGGDVIDDAYSIQQTPDSGYIVAGLSYSTGGNVTGHHGDSTTCDYWVVKLNAGALGIKTIPNNNMISVRPNPTTGMININSSDLVNIGVYNVVGQLVKEANNTDAISIAEFPSGFYIVRLSNAHGQIIYQGKIVKQ